MTTSVRISSIVAALDELLEPALFADLGPNGLQVPGAASPDHPRRLPSLSPAGGLHMPDVQPTLIPFRPARFFRLQRPNDPGVRIIQKEKVYFAFPVY